MTGGTWSLSVAGTVNGNKSIPFTSSIVNQPVSLSQTQSLPFGTGTGLSSIYVGALRGLGAGISETLDLFGGALTDIFGDAATFRVLRSIAIWIASGGDTNGLTIAGGASNPITLFWGGTNPTQTVYPSGPPMMGGSPAGIQITNTAKTILITNNGLVPVTYALLLAGSQGVSGAATGTVGMTYP